MSTIILFVSLLLSCSGQWQVTVGRPGYTFHNRPDPRFWDSPIKQKLHGHGWDSILYGANTVPWFRYDKLSHFRNLHRSCVYLSHYLNLHWILCLAVQRSLIRLLALSYTCICFLQKQRRKWFSALVLNILKVFIVHWTRWTAK